ncbi:unnamed protein product, partial [Lampetra planeri]
APPSPPASVTVEEVTDSTAQLAWSPGRDNGSPITNYLIQTRTPFTVGWQRVNTVPEIIDGNTLTATVVDLNAWVEYEFRVLARNSVGVGEPSPVSVKTRTEDAVPDAAPGDVGRRRWEQPVPEELQNGGSFGYIIAFRAFGEVSWTHVATSAPGASRYVYRNDSIAPFSPFHVKSRAVCQRGVWARSVSASEIEVNWQVLSFTPERVLGYEVVYWEDDTKPETMGKLSYRRAKHKEVTRLTTANSTAQLSLAEDEDDYIIHIQTLSEGGLGPASDPVRIHQLDVTLIPMNHLGDKLQKSDNKLLMYKPIAETDCSFIDTLEDLVALNEKLSSLSEFAVDLEVFHGADSDIEWLQRDFGLYVVNMFDTHQASRALNLARHSLDHLPQHFCKVEADKRYQLADWRIRYAPLPEEMVEYARTDTHYLLYIYDCMRAQLLDFNHGQPGLLQSVWNKSKDISLKKYMKPIFTEDSYLELQRKQKKSFNTQQLTAFRLLFAWRDRLARQEDESTGYVLPTHMLRKISEELPKEPQGIIACCNPVPPLVRQQVNELHLLVQEARDMPLLKLEVNLFGPHDTSRVPESTLPHPSVDGVLSVLSAAFLSTEERKKMKQSYQESLQNVVTVRQQAA